MVSAIGVFLLTTYLYNFLFFGSERRLFSLIKAFHYGNVFLLVLNVELKARVFVFRLNKVSIGEVNRLCNTYSSLLSLVGFCQSSGQFSL